MSTSTEQPATTDEYGGAAPPVEETVHTNNQTSDQQETESDSDSTGADRERPKGKIDGADLLDRIAEWIGRFILVTSPSHLSLLALWTAHTHLAEVLYTTPRLLIDSPVPESGKTTLLEHLGRLCLNPLPADALSPALIPRTLETGMRTILIDEAQRSLRPDKPGVEDLMVVLNRGYRQGATRPVPIPRGKEWVTREMPTFAPLAMAGVAPNLPADTVSRQLRVLLLPDVDGETEDTDWEVLGPDIKALHDDIAVWADQVRDDVKTVPITVPEGCRGRAKEKWRPLKRIAVAAGGRWPQIVDELIGADIAEREAEKEAGLKTLPPGVVLLTDVHKIWPEGQEFVHTTELVKKLILHNPEYWGPDNQIKRTLTAKRLGIMVAKAANTTSAREVGTRIHGYFRSGFTTAWHRLGIILVKDPSETSDLSNPSENNDSDAAADGSDASDASDALHTGVADPSGHPAADNGQDPSVDDKDSSSKPPPQSRNLVEGQCRRCGKDATVDQDNGLCVRCEVEVQLAKQPGTTQEPVPGNGGERLGNDSPDKHSEGPDFTALKDRLLGANGQKPITTLADLERESPDLASGVRLGAWVSIGI